MAKPDYSMVVGEPELKWCEAIIESDRELPHFLQSRNDYLNLIQTQTGMCKPRAIKAINLLYQMKRI